MNQIVLYIGPDRANHEWLITAAGDIIEAMTSPGEQSDSARLRAVAVVADVESCLDIGIVMLGRGESRTVEGGEKSASPVTLFPYSSRDSAEWKEHNRVAVACLLELADLGAVEWVDAFLEEARIDEPEVALQRALEGYAWEGIVALGEVGLLRRVLSRSERLEAVRVIEPLPDAEILERVQVLLRRLDTDLEDAYPEVRRAAVRDAVQLASMLDRLGRRS